MNGYLGVGSSRACTPVSGQIGDAENAEYVRVRAGLDREPGVASGLPSGVWRGWRALPRHAGLICAARQDESLAAIL
jgi:hypothetical protein